MNNGNIEFAEYNNIYILRFIGKLNLNPILCNNLNYIIETIFSNPNFNNIILDLTNAESLDSTTLGLIGKINVCYKRFNSNQIDLFVYYDDVIRLLESSSFDDIFNIIKTINPTINSFNKLPEQQFNKDDFEHLVLESHQILSAINHKNKQEFAEIINCLKNNK